MGRREELEAELVLLAVEERWTKAKAARRKNETPATLKEYQAAHDALSEARAEYRDKRTDKPTKPGDATAKPKGVVTKAKAHKGS